MMILITILVYFALLMLFSRLTSRRSDNDTFYRGNRQSPWYMVAFGMVGASFLNFSLCLSNNTWFIAFVTVTLFAFRPLTA